MGHSVKTHWRLFTSTFLLSAFTFGGGHVIVPLMKKRFVDNPGWLEEQEMLVSILGCVLPSCAAGNRTSSAGRSICPYPA